MNTGPAAAAALDAGVLDDFLLEQCISPLIPNELFQIGWLKKLSSRRRRSLILALFRGCILWITRGRLPGAAAVGLRFDNGNSSRRMMCHCILRCVLPLLFEGFMEYKDLLKKDEFKSSTARIRSVEDMLAFQRQRRILEWIEAVTKRVVPALRWASWTTAYWGAFGTRPPDSHSWTSPELEMRLSGLSYTRDDFLGGSKLARPLNFVYGQRRWLWELFIRSAQLHSAGLARIPQLTSKIFNSAALVGLRARLQELRVGRQSVLNRCTHCGEPPINALPAVARSNKSTGRIRYDCYLCSLYHPNP